MNDRRLYAICQIKSRPGGAIFSQEIAYSATDCSRFFESRKIGFYGNNDIQADKIPETNIYVYTYFNERLP